MALSLWEVFLALLGTSEKSDGDETNRFVPSPLDVSVRVGHGGQDAESIRELSKIHDQARDIEDGQALIEHEY